MFLQNWEIFIEVWLMVVAIEVNGGSKYNVSWLEKLARVQGGWVKECLYMYFEVIEIKMTYINTGENKQIISECRNPFPKFYQAVRRESI